MLHRTAAHKRRDDNMVRICDLIRDEYIEVQTKVCNKNKKRRGFAKKVRDSQKYRNMMSVQDMKDLVKLSYIDIVACARAIKDPSFFEGNENWLKAAFVAFAGANFLGKQSGRPGEWGEVKRTDIEHIYIIFCMSWQT